MSIQIIQTVAEMRVFRKKYDDVAFVPTMGCLHAGHIALVQEAKKYTDNIIVSIFVNPIQFGENEDFDHYPRTLDEDIEKLEKAGVLALFAPIVTEIYPTKQNYYVTPSVLANELCGITRENHFRGVATVVIKLFNIIMPHWAFFGKKDFQQLSLIKEMVVQFNFSIEIIGVPTAREQDGLALSSRNTYLSRIEREQAPNLYRVLQSLKSSILAREASYPNLLDKYKTELIKQGWDVDYLSIRRQKDLSLADETDQDLVVLVAAKLGQTRLIDNIDFRIE